MINLNKIEIILHTGENSTNGYNHLQYWIPEFFKCKVKFAILVRDEKLLKKIKNEYKILNVLFAKSALDVENCLTKLSNLKHIFYMSNPWNNIHLLRFNEFNHIFIGSEYSDKNAEVTKMLRAYDELWLTSNSSIDKIKTNFDISNLTIKTIGKPKFNYSSDKLISDEKKVLLTISKNNFNISNIREVTEFLSSNNYGIEILLDENLRKEKFFFNTLKTELQEYILINNYNCTVLDVVNNDEFQKYDFIICDINSFNYHYFSNKNRIFIYLKDKIEEETAISNNYISFDGLYKFSTFNELKELILKNDFMKNERIAFIKYWMGESYSFNLEVQSILGKGE